jgi:hypothetical protein
MTGQGRNCKEGFDHGSALTRAIRSGSNAASNEVSTTSMIVVLGAMSMIR